MSADWKVYVKNILEFDEDLGFLGLCLKLPPQKNKKSRSQSNILPQVRFKI